MEISLNINGKTHTLNTLPTTKLIYALRQAGCFSVRFGSDDGATGAAAVLVDGKLVNSDTLLVGQVLGKQIETVEGLTTQIGELHPIQKAFIETGAIQSGYSTPAMILAAKVLLATNPNPGEAEVRDALSGILCRETGYVKPVEAVLRAAAYLRGEDVPPYEGPPIIDATYFAEMPPAEGMDDTPDFSGGSTSNLQSPVSTKTKPQTDIELKSGVPETAVVGKSEAKVDAVKLAKGNPAFVDDIEMRGMLYAKLLTSPHAHARILDIDDSQANALPGVRAVIHYKNVERVKYASGGQSYPNPPPFDQVSFDNKVRHVGDRVAAVAADTLAIAEEAIKLIKVEYEVLPAVFDENEAIKPGAPVIHDEADTVDIHDASHNIVHHIEAQLGDVEQGFAEADHVFERHYYVHQVQQAPIEPHIAISWWDEDERLVIRSSTQVPFHTRRMVAPLLGLPVRQIRVIKPRIGGGFGVKQEMLIEDIVGHLTIKTGRPVRMELTRSEEFRSSRTRHPQTITWKTGVMADGTLHSQQFSIVANTGAYGTHGLTVQTVTGLRGLSSYNCPHRQFDCIVAYTNLPVPGAYRGYGAPQALFSLEVHMDEIAQELGMDPIEFRRKNWVQAGDPMPIAPLLGEGEKETVTDVPLIESCGLNECFAQGMKAVDWERKYQPGWHEVPGKPHLRRGLGAAMCMHGTAIPGLDMGGASIKMNDDGSFNVLVGATDLGTGSDTVLAQMAAEVLGVPLADILMYSSDTDMTPFDVGAYASSTTYISGTAVKHAAEKVAEQIRERAALMLELDSWDRIRLENKLAIAPDGRSVTLEAVALHSLHQADQRQIMATASYVSAASPPPFAGQFAEVEVDIETGQVTVTKLVMAVDAGVPINPLTASGQVEGGMTQALGYGHCEEMAYDASGNLLNDEFGPYHIYRADEMPWMKAILVQTNEPTGPFGAKAIAEIPKDGVAPALANAIFDATGVRVRRIPFTPQRIYNALQTG
ncbi:MAG: molybdopterin-dependent oxidoreductase [Ardenticatenaceae bacterium]|nr:molybdopterin-dependent oxidoreductase [Ardenticatenaceae bacterium]MCB8991420.1 molybdopterin-dependent oxidoreductase [Ardenticatenaceae bacterium]MCB9003850.1 molybdopterin-dependent oxidoreductase [Ardenticatenaceae bacterium]